MAVATNLKRYKRLIIWAAAILLSLFIILLIFVNRFIEPLLKDRINTLIIQGSDSLYTYKLGKLNANFFGGNVEVENLQISVDSNHYNILRQRNALPSLTMQLSLQRGYIKGVGIFSLLFGRKVKVEEILSHEADIKLSRHIRPNDIEKQGVPLWKAIQPKINSIYVGRIKLEGIKLLYTNADTSESVKLQFDRCDALFDDIQIDSASNYDTTRVGFTKDIAMRFNDLKFRTQDSLYKMKAKWITYSSKSRILEVDSFKLQPTLDKEDFYKAHNTQTSLYYVNFEKVRYVNIRLDHFIHNNIIDADSLVFVKPDLSIYLDRSGLPDYESKIGKYPQQQLLKAGETIIIKNISVKDAQIQYTEKNPENNQEGTLKISNMNLAVNNVTNDSLSIRKNPVCLAQVQGTILGNSPFNVQFRLYLDSTNGRYDATGSIKNVTTAQLSPLALSLANVQINSFNINNLDFHVIGEDYHAISNVKMLYNNLSLTLRKTDEETGETKTKKFLTKLLNKFVIWPNNPGPDGIERVAQNREVARLTTQSFFGLLWKAVFAGMQDIMMKSGRYG